MVGSMADVVWQPGTSMWVFQLNFINKTQSPELSLPEGHGPHVASLQATSCKTVAQRESPGPAGPGWCPLVMAPPQREVKAPVLGPPTGHCQSLTRHLLWALAFLQIHQRGCINAPS